MEHKNCKECPHNNYPFCKVKKDFKGGFERIDNLVESYDCQGFKDDDRVYDDSKYIKQKSALELKIEDLQNQINSLKELEKG